MADQKISELTALTGANVADDDAIAIVDTSATETKKIVFSELKNALDTATGFVRITGDTMTGALDVQSTITSDGLTVDGVASIQPSSASIPSGGNTSADDLIIQSSGHTGMTIGSGTSSTGSIYFADSGSNSIGRIQYNHTDNSLYLQTNAEKRLNISSGGDISFYEDTGTTAKFFWDASAESLGIGTTSPSAKLHSNVGAASTTGVLAENANDAASTGDLIKAYSARGNTSAYNLFKAENSTGVKFLVSGDGNVGIGTDAPSTPLHVVDPSTSYVFAETTGTGTSAGFRLKGDASADYTLFTTQGTNQFAIYDNAAAAERMRIDSSGNLLVANTTGASADTGHIFAPTGVAFHVRDGGIPLVVDRLTNDGDLQLFRKDGSTVGSIGSNTTSGQSLLDLTATQNFRLLTNGSERMRIDSNGNVGIGVTPLSKLHIEDTSGAVLTLGNSQNPNDVVTGTVFGRMNFYASDRSGTTSTGGVARIEAIASAGYSGSTPSDLLFYTHGTSANDGSTLGNPTERMRIDSSGNLILKATSDTGNRLQINGADETSELLEIGITSGHAQLTATHASGGANTAGFIFRTRGGGSTAERMRITSAGELLVGTTSTILDAEENEEQGVDIRPEGFVKISRSSNHPLQLARTDDGEIVKFRSNETTVGSIGVSGGNNLYIGSTASLHAGLTFATRQVLPNIDGVTLNDGGTDLGNSSNRFRDLYLSGGVYLGGTGAANKLDDYEEGTWTPVIIGSGVAGSGTYGSQNGTYTKIGRTVTFRFYLTWTNHTGSGSIEIGGFPFNAASQTYYLVQTEAISLLSNSLAPASRIEASSNKGLLIQSTTGGSSRFAVNMDTAGEINGQGTYQTS